MGGDKGSAAMPQGESLAYGNPFMPAGGIIGNKATGGGPGVGKPSPNISLGGGQLGSMQGAFGDTGAGVNFGGDSFKLSGGGNQLSATDINTEKTVSSKDYKEKVKFEMLGMAQKSVEDLSSFRNFGFNPQGMPGEQQPAWQKGYGVNDIYNPLMQQAMQRRQMESVQRFNQGRSANG